MSSSTLQNTPEVEVTICESNKSRFKSSVVTVTVNRSTDDEDDTHRFVFEETTPNRLTPAGRFLGSIPPVVADAVENNGYRVAVNEVVQEDGTRNVWL